MNIDPEPAAGWISGRRYLVLLDHAWNRGSPRPVAISGAEHRVTVGVMPVRLFESLERNRLTRSPLRALVKRRGLRDTAILLGPKLGRLNPEAIARLDDALRFVLGL